MNILGLGEGLQKLVKAVDKYKYVLLVLVIGIVIMIVPSSSAKDKASTGAAVSAATDFSLEEFQKRLEDVLSQIDGVGNAAVTLTLKTGEEKVLAVDRQISQVHYEDTGRTESDEKASTVVVSSGSGGQEVVVLQSTYPTFQGALIVCEGGDSASIRLKVTEAVSALTGIGADKISVVKMK